MLKQKIESRFGQLGKLSYEKPWFFILLSLLIVVFFVWQLQFVIIDTSTEGFLKKTDQALITYNKFRGEFGRDESFIIAVETEDVFTREFADTLIAMHKALEIEVPHVDDVTSLYNIRDIYGEDDELYVEDFLEELPEDEQGWQALKEKAYAHPLYKNSYFSADGKMAILFVRPVTHYAKKHKKTGEVTYELLGENEIHNMFVSIQSVIKSHLKPETRFYIAGTPALTEELNVYLVGDMLKFIFLVLVVISAILFLLFRRITPVILPLLVMITALLSTMGLMSLTRQPIQMPTVILPSFILAVGVGDAIHLLTIFFRRMKLGEDKKQALQSALSHTGLPIFFTSLTTAASLCSFGQSEILPVANLGLFAAAGVMFAFLYTILLLPALLAITPIQLRQSKPEKQKKYTLFDAFLDFSIRFSKDHSIKIVVICMAVLLVSLYSASQLYFSHNPVKWLPEESPGRLSVEVLDNKIEGTVSIEFVIDSGEYDGIKDAEFMAMLDEISASLESYETERLKVGKVLSVVRLLKETNKALFGNQPSEYRVPDNRALIAQEFLMLETSGAEDLFKLVDRNYQKARITVLTPWTDAVYLGDYTRDLQALVEAELQSRYRYEVTGIVPMLAKTLKQIMTATAYSYMIAFVVITFMMIALLGSFKYGLVSMLPNLLPISMALGLMQVTGAPLDMFSMLIGSIAIGLSVDDTVHFMHGFRRVYEQTGDAERAVDETLHTSGRAMLTTSIVLCSGFLIYLFSVMNNLQDFGTYTALCIGVALLADFWMAPALVLIMNRNKK